MKINKEQLLNLSDYILIDVRELDEYNDGHLPNAILIPYHLIEYRIDELNQYKNKNIVLYCQSGRRSSIALSILNKYGFNNVYDLGSITNFYSI